MWCYIQIFYLVLYLCIIKHCLNSIYSPHTCTFLFLFHFLQDRRWWLYGAERKKTKKVVEQAFCFDVDVDDVASVSIHSFIIHFNYFVCERKPLPTAFQTKKEGRYLSDFQCFCFIQGTYIYLNLYEHRQTGIPNKKGGDFVRWSNMAK